MTNNFYKKAKALDYLKILDNPSINQQTELIDLISDEKFARYFFNDLLNPIWIPILHEFGYYSKSPEPIEVQPGSFKLPDWPALNYLVKFAPQYEDIFAAITKITKTSNWRVQALFIEGLLKITSETASTCIFVIDAWLDAPFSDMLPNDLIPLAERFIESGFIPSAIQINDFILKPVLKRTKDTFSRYDPPYGFRSDPYWVGEFCEKVIPGLMRIEPHKLLENFQNHLEMALALTKEIGIEDYEEKLGYIWRMNIAYGSPTRGDGNITDILIDGLRDSLDALCELSPEIGKEKIYELLHSQHLIFQRIAIHTLRKYGQNYPELLGETISHWEYTEKDEYLSEYQGLVRDQFINISDETKAEIIEKIQAGPSDLENRALRIAGWKNHDLTEDDLIEAKERWIQFYLELINASLPKPQRQILEGLNAKYGKADVEEKPKITFTSSWETIPSPIAFEDLAKKDFSELKQSLLEYEPDNGVLNSHDTLARTFQSIVSNEPEKYLDFAQNLIDPTIRFVYTYNFLFGIRETVRNKGIKLTDNLLSLCEFVIQQEKDPYEKPPDLHEAGLFTAQLEVAHLLNDAVQSSDPYLSRAQLDWIRNILIHLSHHTDPTKEDDESNKMDAFTHSLNCVRGEAMHGIFNYSLYLVRQKQNEKKGENWFIEEEIIEILNEKLDAEKETSPSVRAVIGSYLTQLFFMAKEWTEKKLDLIFPPQQEYELFWAAAWDGYIIGSNINKALFNLIIPQYQRGLKRLSKPKEMSFADPSERLAQHVMVAYLNDLTGFGHENQILDFFYENASDQLRSQAVFWLSKVLESEKPAAESPLWLKCWTLWQKRIEYAEKQEASKNNEEISNYMRWLPYCPLTLDELYSVLIKSIRYFQIGYNIKQLSDFGAKYSEQSALKAVTLLSESVTNAKEPWWSPEEEDERKILSAAMRSKDHEAKRIAIELINYHGEQGDYRWRDLINI